MQKLYRFNGQELSDILIAIVKKATGDKSTEVHIKDVTIDGEKTLIAEVLCDEYQPKDSVHAESGQDQPDAEPTAAGRTGEEPHSCLCQSESKVAHADCACHAHGEREPKGKTLEDPKTCSHPKHMIAQWGNSAYCVRCGKMLGWWCPNSPNHQCEYPDEEVHGDLICKWCGQPEERL